MRFEVAAVVLLLVVAVVQADPMETAAAHIVVAVAAGQGEAGGLSIPGFRVLQVTTQHYRHQSRSINK